RKAVRGKTTLAVNLAVAPPSKGLPQRDLHKMLNTSEEPEAKAIIQRMRKAAQEKKAREPTTDAVKLAGSVGLATALSKSRQTALQCAKSSVNAEHDME
ncbi:MAG: hypothetical protein M3N08_06035, partial [Pseudomonadota bacterium]|nr:hypothetical protein [Pseudomonadota bacterium]